MEGFERHILRENAGDTAVDKLNKASSDRQAAGIRLNEAISDFVDAWEAEDEALKEVYGEVFARNIDGYVLASPADVLRVFEDTINHEKNEEA